MFHAGGSTAPGRDRGYGAVGGGSAVTRASLARIRTGDPGEQVEGLAEICDELAVCNEESLLAFPLDTAVPLLVRPCAWICILLCVCVWVEGVWGGRCARADTRVINLDGGFPFFSGERPRQPSWPVQDPLPEEHGHPGLQT